MNIYDALKMLAIKSTEITKEEVKKAYREFSLKYHPDRNPSGENMMKMLNEAYSTLEKADYPIKMKEGVIYDYSEEISQALNAIIHLQGVKIEICGSWVWLSGSTKDNKDEIKGAGFLFSGNKKMWYFRPQSKIRYYGKKSKTSIQEIRDKYGSQSVRSKNSNTLTYA